MTFVTNFWIWYDVIVGSSQVLLAPDFIEAMIYFMIIFSNLLPFASSQEISVVDQANQDSNE